MQFEFSRQIFEEYLNIKFIKNPSCGSRVIPCRRTDRHDTANSRFIAILPKSPKSQRGPSANTKDITVGWMRFHGGDFYFCYLQNIRIIKSKNDRWLGNVSILKSLSNVQMYFCSFIFGATSPQLTRASSFMRFLDHTQRRTTVCSTPLDQWSARSRDIYLTTHNTHNRQKSMPRRNSNPQPQEASGRRPTP
jgi:hypothetical protein